ncbi:MAG: hypothetical protein ACRD9L_21915 [Bryobacteraceae bacterium]
MPEPKAPTEGALPEVSQSDDFAAFESWRRTGEEPKAETAKADETPAATDDDPQAKTAPDSETDEEEQEEETEEAPKKKGGFQRRIDKLTERNRSLEDRLQAMEGRLAPKPAETAAPATADGAPKAENFKTYDDFVEALADYKLDQRDKARAAQAAQTQVEAAQKAVADRWGKQLEDAKSRYNDFEDVVGVEIPISHVMAQAIQDSEQGADLAYWLGKHPKEAERIVGLSPLAAVRELGKIEAQIAKTTPEPKKSTSAPKPPATVGGKSGGERRLDDPDLEFGDFEKMRRAQLSRKK